MTGNILTCPDCRLTIKVPSPPDVSFLPSNFFVNNLLATLSLSDRTSESGFGVCGSCRDEQAETKCDHCAQCLCHSCTQPHKKSCHNSPVATEIIYCSKHPGQSVKLFCKTCQETICQDCMTLSHHQHHYVVVSEAAEAKKAELMKLLEAVEIRKSEISANLSSLKKKEETLNENNESTLQQIEAHFTSLIEVLVRRKEKLITTVKSTQDDRLKQLHCRQEDLQIMAARCESSVSYTEQTIRNSNNVQLLDSAKDMSESLVGLKDQKIGENSVENGSLVFEAEDSTEEELSKLVQNSIVREREIQPNSSCSAAPTIAPVVSTFAHVYSASTGATATGYGTPSSTSSEELFPSGSLVGNRVFRPGIHWWSVEIDHSNCPGRDRADFEIGVISNRDGSTVTLRGFIKPGRFEVFNLELNSHEDNLRVEPPWDSATNFDVCDSILSPYLEIDCKHCEVDVTEQDFFWAFERQ